MTLDSNFMHTKRAKKRKYNTEPEQWFSQRIIFLYLEFLVPTAMLVVYD